LELLIDTGRGLFDGVHQRLAGLTAQEGVAPAQQVIRQELIDRSCNGGLPVGVIAFAGGSAIECETKSQSEYESDNCESHPRPARARLGQSTFSDLGAKFCGLKLISAGATLIQSQEALGKICSAAEALGRIAGGCFGNVLAD